MLDRIHEDRFWSKVERHGDGCWEWQAARSQSGQGYGMFGVGKRKRVNAHVVAYEWVVGPVPKGLRVLHTCDNRGCVNPSHLFLGTQSDNLLDASRKGRLPHAKLTDDQVRTIRALTEPSRVLAQQFGVHEGHIRKVRIGRAKSHV